jgi:hypothetical protein
MKSASGRFILRLPVHVHDALRNDAALKGLSLNSLCAKVLAEYIESKRDPGSISNGERPKWTDEIRDMFGGSLRGIVLFGSAARGESRENSDIDLLIVVGEEIPLSRRVYMDWDEKFADEKVSPHFVHLPRDLSAAGSIWLEASVDGMVLFEKEGIVSRFLGRLRGMIASGEARRSVVCGHSYWTKAEGASRHVQ